MQNKDKEIEKLDEQLKNMPKPNLTDHQKRKIHQTVMHASRPVPYKKYSVLLGSIAALFVFSFLIFTAILKDDQSDVTTGKLLDSIITKAGSEYRFENIPWFKTKDELAKKGYLPSESDSENFIDEENDWEEIISRKEIKFSNTNIKADIIIKYKFFHNLFVGGEFIISMNNEDDLIKTSHQLKKHLEHEFPKPQTNSLDSLSEDVIKESNNIGIGWWEGENKINFSSFEIDLFNRDEHETYTILIRVDSAKSKVEDILKDKLGVHPLESDQTLISALQGKLNTEDKVNIEKINKIDNDVFGIFTLESQTPQQGVFYTSQENNEWIIHEIDATQLDQDTPFTHQQLLGDSENSSKPFKITAGYINDQVIDKIQLNYQNGDTSLINIGPNHQAYIHVQFNHKDISEEEFSIINIKGLDEGEQVMFEYKF